MAGRDDGFAQSPQTRAAEEDCLRFLLLECPAATHAFVRSQYEAACTIVPPAPPAPPAPPPAPPLPPGEPPPVAPAPLSVATRARDEELDSDPECEIVTYLQCRQMTERFAALHPGFPSSMTVSLAACEGLEDETDCMTGCSFGSRTGGSYRFLLPDVEAQFGPFNPKRCKYAARPFCACSNHAPPPPAIHAPPPPVQFAEGWTPAAPRTPGSARLGGAAAPPVVGPGGTSEVSALTKRIANARTIDLALRASAAKVACPGRDDGRSTCARYCANEHLSALRAFTVAGAAPASPVAAADEGRAAEVPGPPSPPSAPFNACSNDCALADALSDADRTDVAAQCRDGGKGSFVPALCAFGTSCATCGFRENTRAIVGDDSCAYAGNRVCEDGGEGSSFFTDAGGRLRHKCALGTDDADCAPHGVRLAAAATVFAGLANFSRPSPPPPPLPLPLAPRDAVAAFASCVTAPERTCYAYFATDGNAYGGAESIYFGKRRLVCSGTVAQIAAKIKNGVCPANFTIWQPASAAKPWPVAQWVGAAGAAVDDPQDGTAYADRCAGAVCASPVAGGVADTCSDGHFGSVLWEKMSACDAGSQARLLHTPTLHTAPENATMRFLAPSGIATHPTDFARFSRHARAPPPPTAWRPGHALLRPGGRHGTAPSGTRHACPASPPRRQCKTCAQERPYVLTLGTVDACDKFGTLVSQQRSDETDPFFADRDCHDGGAGSVDGACGFGTQPTRCGERATIFTSVLQHDLGAQSLAVRRALYGASSANVVLENERPPPPPPLPPPVALLPGQTVRQSDFASPPGQPPPAPRRPPPAPPPSPPPPPPPPNYYDFCTCSCFVEDDARNPGEAMSGWSDIEVRARATSVVESAVLYKAHATLARGAAVSSSKLIWIGGVDRYAESEYADAELAHVATGFRQTSAASLLSTAPLYAQLHTKPAWWPESDATDAWTHLPNMSTSFAFWSNVCANYCFRRHGDEVQFVEVDLVPGVRHLRDIEIAGLLPDMLANPGVCKCFAFVDPAAASPNRSRAAPSDVSTMQWLAGARLEPDAALREHVQIFAAHRRHERWHFVPSLQSSVYYWRSLSPGFHLDEADLGEMRLQVAHADTARDCLVWCARDQKDLLKGAVYNYDLGGQNCHCLSDSPIDVRFDARWKYDASVQWEFYDARFCYRVQGASDRSLVYTKATSTVRAPRTHPRAPSCLAGRRATPVRAA